MAQKVNITIDITDPQLAVAVQRIAETIPALKTASAVDLSDQKTISSFNGNKPNIVLIDDRPESGDIFKRLLRLHGDLPGASIFVLSEDNQPEHIVKLMKAGAAEYFPVPLNVDNLKKAVEEVQLKLISSAQATRGSVYSFISSKGGLGSTVIAVNTAAAMAGQDNCTPALCDMSFQSGDSTVLLDMVPETSIEDICHNFSRLDLSLLKGAMLKHSSGIELLAAPRSQENADEIHVEHITSVLDIMTRLYDYVIIDCTSMYIDECAVETFNISDKVFVIMDLSVPAIRNAARFFQLIRKIGISEQKIEFVVNRFTKNSAGLIETAEKNLGKKIFWLFPNDFDGVISSINQGVPLVQLRPHSHFAKNIGEFFNKLKEPQYQSTYRGVRNAFGKTI